MSAVTKPYKKEEYGGGNKECADFSLYRRRNEAQELSDRWTVTYSVAEPPTCFLPAIQRRPKQTSGQALDTTWFMGHC